MTTPGGDVELERRGLLLLEGFLAALSLVGIYLLVPNVLRELICAGMCSSIPSSEEVNRAWMVSAVLVCTVVGQLAAGSCRTKTIPAFHGLVFVAAAIVIGISTVPLI